MGGTAAGGPAHAAGRNQAMHWEEDNPNPGVVECFEKLAERVRRL
ncbi:MULTISPECIES: hypothetical protein [Streptomyces]|uniref:Uncharacterized protein n=1 Tax=Streptomyces flaveolus TaxID=67297 RepID=A0ABV3AQC6_9ACTN|nr:MULTISPECIES: hypothetical protein [Streptomyces]